MWRKLLFAYLAWNLSPALAEPITLTCVYFDPVAEQDKKIQFTVDPVENKLADSFNPSDPINPTLPAFAVWDDFWFFHQSKEDGGEFGSSSVVLNTQGFFWLLVFLDRKGTENDGGQVITGKCPPIPKTR